MSFVWNNNAAPALSSDNLDTWGQEIGGGGGSTLDHFTVTVSGSNEILTAVFSDGTSKVINYSVSDSVRAAVNEFLQEEF